MHLLLSREGDVRSQWWAYSDDSAGFIVGFSSQRMKKQGEERLSQRGSQLWDVICDDDSQAKCLDHYI